MRANTVVETLDYKFRCDGVSSVPLDGIRSEHDSSDAKKFLHYEGAQRWLVTHAWDPMIFGFNTDVQHENTVYHIQSEARKADLLLQTMVFVRGHCIGKYGSSYAEQVSDPGFSEEHIHELLKKQHRGVVDVVKAGSIDQFFREQTEIRDAEGESLGLTWLNSDEPVADRKLIMRILVSDAGAAVDGALVTSRLQYPAGVPIHSQAVSEEDGRVELELDLTQMEKTSNDPVVFVRASHGERSVTRKYRLKAPTS